MLHRDGNGTESETKWFRFPPLNQGVCTNRKWYTALFFSSVKKMFFLMLIVIWLSRTIHRWKLSLYGSNQFNNSQCGGISVLNTYLFSVVVFFWNYLLDVYVLNKATHYVLLYNAACFEIVHVILNSFHCSLNCHVTLLSSVALRLDMSLKEVLWFAYLDLKLFSVSQ